MKRHFKSHEMIMCDLKNHLVWLYSPVLGPTFPVILCDYKNNHTCWKIFDSSCVIIKIITRKCFISCDYKNNHTGWVKKLIIMCDYKNNHTRWNIANRRPVNLQDDEILCDYKNNHTIFRYFLKYCVIIFIITQYERFKCDYFYNHTIWYSRVTLCDYFLEIFGKNHIVWLKIVHCVIILSEFRHFKSHKMNFFRFVLIYNQLHKNFAENQLV